MNINDELLNSVAECIYERLHNKQWKFAPLNTKRKYLDAAHSTLILIKLVEEK